MRITVTSSRPEAVLCHVQLDESDSNRGCTVRLPGLHPDASYDVRWLGPTDRSAMSKSPAPAEIGPTSGVPVSGLDLATLGFWMPRRAPLTVQLIEISATSAR